MSNTDEAENILIQARINYIRMFRRSKLILTVVGNGALCILDGAPILFNTLDDEFISVESQVFVALANFIALSISNGLCFYNGNKVINSSVDSAKIENNSEDADDDYHYRAIAIFGKQVGIIVGYLIFNEFYCIPESIAYIPDKLLNGIIGALCSILFLAVVPLYYWVREHICGIKDRNSHAYAILGDDSFSKYCKVALNVGLIIGQGLYVLLGLLAHSTVFLSLPFYFSGAVAGIICCFVALLMVPLLNWLTVQQITIKSDIKQDITKIPPLSFVEKVKNFFGYRVFLLNDQGSYHAYVFNRWGVLERLPIESQKLAEYIIKSPAQLDKIKIAELHQEILTNGKTAIFTSHKQKWWKRNYFRSGLFLGGGLGTLLGLALVPFLGLNLPLIFALYSLGALLGGFVLTYFHRDVSWTCHVLWMNPKIILSNSENFEFSGDAAQGNIIRLNYANNEWYFITKNNKRINLFCNADDMVILNATLRLDVAKESVIPFEQLSSNAKEVLYKVYSNIDHELNYVSYITYKMAQYSALWASGLLFLIFLLLHINPVTLPLMFIVLPLFSSLIGFGAWLFGLYCVKSLNSPQISTMREKFIISWIERIDWFMFPGSIIGAFVGLIVSYTCVALLVGSFIVPAAPLLIWLLCGMNIGALIGAVVYPFMARDPNELFKQKDQQVEERQNNQLSSHVAERVAVRC